MCGIEKADQKERIAKEKFVIPVMRGSCVIGAAASFLLVKFYENRREILSQKVSR